MPSSEVFHGEINMHYYKITYEVPGAGARNERFGCFGRMKQKFTELVEKYGESNVKWEKVERKKETK
jgi:hypothetical protein